MLKNHLKIAFRNLSKNKVFSLLNFTGLAVGMSAFFLISLYVNFERNYDAFHSKADRIYRLVCDVKTFSETINTFVSSGPMGKNIKKEYPEVEEMVRLFSSNQLVRVGTHEILEEPSMFADPSIFKIFDFKLISGDPETALTDPFNVVISKTAAKKYFGNENPLGKTLILGTENYVSQITGVMEDIPKNSQIKAEFFISMETYKRTLTNFDEQWGNFGAVTFLLLNSNSDPKTLQSKFPSFIEKHIGKKLKEDQMNYTLHLEPLKDVYLKSKRGGFETGNINNVYIFSIISIFILLIAFINYINLTTARASERAKEVGIKKVVGAGRTQLLRQFLSESTLTCFLAFVLSVFFSFLCLPLFNHLSGKVVSLSIFEHPVNLILLFVLSIGIGIVSGIYPALVLSSFKPILVLKGKFSSGTKGILLRKGLVVAQFTISIALIIATIVVYFQLNFMQNEELGFNKNQLAVIDMYQDKQKEILKQKFLKIPGVVSASLASSIPGGSNSNAFSLIESSSGEMIGSNLAVFFVDYDYIPQFQMKIVAGRTFSTDYATDTSSAMVINEAAVQLFGYGSADAAIGKRYSQWGSEGTIIGVVRNFHFRSLRENIKPFCMRIDPRAFNLLTVKLSGKDIKKTIASMETQFKQQVSGRPFNYVFVDEYFNAQYKGEEQFGNLFLHFAILAISISCLGLLGLALFSTTQRTKEIGIRKVLGASVVSIVNLLSKDFLKLVFCSFCLASPIAGWMMFNWLENFEYRISLSWWIFPLAGIIAIAVAFSTISFYSIKAAILNPVKSLKSE